ncbi:MAG: phosphonate ABC transporter, permease protein PhnE, partial [Comamonadaceae bacterium]
MISIGNRRLLVGASAGNPGWWTYVAAALAGLGVVWWAGVGSQVSVTELWKGMP